jgi:Protein of unknown function (DUF4231)
MDAQTYLKDRVEDQLRYFNNKSKSAKWWYQKLQLAAIVSGVLVPVFIGFSSQWPDLKYVAAVCGALVAIIESAQSLLKYKENWLTFRATAEALVRERFLFEHGAGVYANQQDKYRLFVEHIEQILSTENRVWLTVTKTSEDKKAI